MVNLFEEETPVKKSHICTRCEKEMPVDTHKLVEVCATCVDKQYGPNITWKYVPTGNKSI